MKAAGRRFAGIIVEPDSPRWEEEFLAESVDGEGLRVHVDEAFPMTAVGAGPPAAPRAA